MEMSSYQRHRKRKKKRKRVPLTQLSPQGERCDEHHLLWQGRHFTQGYAKMLRQHPYARVRIPMRTLHREIHSKIHDVPRPNGDICKRAYYRLVEGCKIGELDPRNDSPEKRLQFFIDEWAEDCPATVEVLRWQQQIIRKFYSRKGVRMMGQEIRWEFQANILYETQEDRDEVYSILTTNGISPNCVTGNGKRLEVSTPGVNMTLFLRYSEIMMRFPTAEQSICLHKVG